MAAGGTPVLREFLVYSWDAEQYQSYQLDISSCGPTLVDALLKIRHEQDPSLGVSVGCRRGRCGACACTINGRNGLACQTRLDVAGVVVPKFTVKSITPPLVQCEAH